MKVFFTLSGLFCLGLVVVFSTSPSDPHGFSVLANLVYLIGVYLFGLFSYATYRLAKRLKHSAKDPMPAHLHGMVARNQMPDWAKNPSKDGPAG